MEAVKSLFSEIKTLPQEHVLEVYNFVLLLKAKQVKPKKTSAFGCLNEYADPSKIPLEKEAWEREAARKHAPN